MCKMALRDPKEWVAYHFSGVPYSNQRLANRLLKVAGDLAAHPGTSIPARSQSLAATKGAYRLFQHTESTPERIQAVHRSRTHQSLQEPGTYLLIEDSSILSWSGKKEITGLGSIGHGGKGIQGFYLHSVIATKWSDDYTLDSGRQKVPLEILGLADQRYEVLQGGRKPRRHLCSARDCHRKSDKWIDTAHRVPTPGEGVHYIRVCDREADIYEAIRESQLQGLDFIIRIASNRTIRPESNPSPCLLMDWSLNLAAMGSFEVEVRGKSGRMRLVELSVAYEEVLVGAPSRHGKRRNELPALRCTVIRVWEANPPVGEEGISWLLYCGHPIHNLESARVAIMQYACRWLIEDYHKSLKTCLKAENLQMKSSERLFSAVSVMAIVALGILALRERGRLSPEAPAHDSGLTSLQLRLLQASTGRELATVGDVVLAVGKLGGHLNRKRDGMPGVITLWRGMNHLLQLEQGARLATRHINVKNCG